MEDNLYITLADFADYKDISPNIDQDRLDTYIRDAQILDLRAFLGQELYLQLQLSYTPPDVFTGVYEPLFEGVDYNDIRYYGLKPLLVEYAYARLLEEISLNITRTGAKVFTTEEGSEPPTQSQINTKVSAARSIALAYEADATKFLKANLSDYPKWHDTNDKKTGFNFFKV